MAASHLLFKLLFAAADVVSVAAVQTGAGKNFNVIKKTKTFWFFGFLGITRARRVHASPE